MNCARQFVRDLLWAVNSPALLRTRGDHRCDSTEWGLKEQDICETHLADFVVRRDTHSLGKYFETLVSYWLHHLRKVDVLFESFAIREQKRTLGEVDFVFVDEQGRMTHWEVAVKFYLFSPLSSVSDSHYLGPNAMDTLDRKIGHVFGRQLPRSLNHFPDVELREAFVKGRIFYPLVQQRSECEHPYVSGAHLNGLWFRQADIAGRESDADWGRQDSCFLVLNKPYWLSNVDASHASDTLLSFREFLNVMDKHFSASQRCLLVVQLKSDGLRYLEIQRFFVVPNSWPD